MQCCEFLDVLVLSLLVERAQQYFEVFIIDIALLSKRFVSLFKNEMAWAMGICEIMLRDNS